MRRLSLPGCLTGSSDSVGEAAAYLHAHIQAHVGVEIPNTCRLLHEPSLQRMLDAEETDAVALAAATVDKVAAASAAMTRVLSAAATKKEVCVARFAARDAFGAAARAQHAAAEATIRATRASVSRMVVKRTRNALADRINANVPSVDFIAKQISSYAGRLQMDASLLFSVLVLMNRFAILSSCPFSVTTWRPMFFVCLVLVHKNSFDTPYAMQRYAAVCDFYSPRLLVAAEAFVVSAAEYATDVTPNDYSRGYLWARMIYKYTQAPARRAHCTCRLPAFGDVDSLKWFVLEGPAAVCLVGKACDDLDLCVRNDRGAVPFAGVDYRETPVVRAPSPTGSTGRETQSSWSTLPWYDVARPLPRRQDQV